MILTFNELRRLKDKLPDGSMKRIADKMGLHEETIRNYFGGHNYKSGDSVGMHIEQGPDGGIVTIDDSSIYDIAQSIIEEKNKN